MDFESHLSQRGYFIANFENTRCCFFKLYLGPYNSGNYDKLYVLLNDRDKAKDILGFEWNSYRLIENNSEYKLKYDFELK